MAKRKGREGAEREVDLVERIRRDRIDFVNLQFVDLSGSVKSVTIPSHSIEEVLEKGCWFDGSSIEGFVRIFESDMFLRPDPSTYQIIPWQSNDSNVARFICDVHSPDGKEFEGSPRGILKRALKAAREMGYVYNTGPEIEFFLMRKDGDRRVHPVPHDSGGYFDLSMDLGFEVRKRMVTSLERMGITVEASHHEVAPGQHEIDFKYDDALSTADKVVTLKFTLKAIAESMGIHATFMPKPVQGINGSGMHTHQSLSLVKGGENAFYDTNDPYHLSETAYRFIAGQLAHVREICAVLAPLVNSYKRLVPGFEAPVYVSWARINRSSLIRVPKCFEGRESSTRIEIRCPDPSANPYLAFAVLLRAGLEGIRRKLDPPDPIEEDLYKMDGAGLARRDVEMLPGTLGEAISEIKRSKIVRETLGNHAFDRYVDALEHEWDGYRMHVTPWEIKRYLERY